MNTYRVFVYETICHSVFIETDNESEAKKIAYEVAMNESNAQAAYGYEESSLGISNIEIYKEDE